LRTRDPITEQARRNHGEQLWARTSAFLSEQNHQRQLPQARPTCPSSSVIDCRHHPRSKHQRATSYFANATALSRLRALHTARFERRIRSRTTGESCDSRLAHTFIATKPTRTTPGYWQAGFRWVDLEFEQRLRQSCSHWKADWTLANVNVKAIWLERSRAEPS
jgi:hypothetical protein